MITSWSFSRYSCYMECPAKAKFKFVDKRKEPGSAAMDRGTELHKMAENYLRDGGRIPKELKLITDKLKDFRKRKAIPEGDFTFKKDWSPTRWDDWNGAWVRIKADVTLPPLVDIEGGVVEIHDFKSGGKVDEQGAVIVKDEYNEQMELYTLGGLLTYQTAKTAVASLIFIDHGQSIESAEAHRKDLAKLKKKWELRTKKMLSDTAFKPTPGNACRWCHFRKGNGGPCPW